MAEKDPAQSGKRLHVTTLLVASRRALDNALAELGFAEDDDRVVEHDGRLAQINAPHRSRRHRTSVRPSAAVIGPLSATL